MVDIPSLIASPAKIILGKIAKLMLTEIGLILNRKEGLKRLQRSLLQIQAIEDDVEERALNQRAWQIWLRDLRDVAYKAEDLLDTIAVYQSLRSNNNSQLSSMPPGIGMLTELQTLSAFVVSKRSNLQEMRSLHNLRGTLCILNLENVGDEQEAKDAVLSDKQYLRRLDFHWSEPKHGESVVQMDILTRLKPHKNLKELYIRNYVGFKFPIWLGDPSFSKLVEISLQNCPECDILPPLGKLPALKYLHIATTRISYINRSFCGARGATGFPLLETLEFDDMDKLVFWDGVVQGDLPYLRQLVISSCPKLTAVPMLKYLHRLEQFELKNCPLFPMLPEDVLPTELKSLSVSGCTQLKNWCHFIAFGKSVVCTS
ncbi:hypothetical protein GIB67_014460 [Kingdonia uniflora]|uniref:Rx N-terminal domain-containing protein n=1 Tax=Kingdonia uniflora TaxID=39325 RepID=A0A7J7LZA6_9MAGN|nr:hypothetical protein GIB67_014460 [Kingdonia uniflora]